MTTFSLCMIVKNEENNLNKCIESTKDLFDEIIIVDTGSIDNTKEIAKKYTDKIYDFKWINDFSAARNYAFSKATKDYIVWLDADDIIKENDYKKLKKLKQEMNPDIDVIMLKYNIAFDLKGNPTFSYFRERILKRIKNYKWNDRVHEFIAISGNIKREDIAITHTSVKKENSKRNLKIYQTMEKNKEIFTPRNLYYYGRELYDHRNYKKAIQIMKKFLKTNRGWIEDNINACIILYECYMEINKIEEALNCLFETFNYDIPRPKTSSLIGSHFAEKNDYHKAIYWYKQAIINKNSDANGFQEIEYSEFIPLINLVVCYDAIGNKDLARKYHEKVKRINPAHPSVIHNDNYFNKL